MAGRKLYHTIYSGCDNIRALGKPKGSLCVHLGDEFPAVACLTFLVGWQRKLQISELLKFAEDYS